MANRKSRFDTTEIFAGLDKLQAKKEPVARAMGSAMAGAVRDEAKVRVPVGTDFGGSLNPGTLRDAIYQAYDARRNVLNNNTYRYVVSWNHNKAPHGHLIEFGHWMPYIYATDGQGHYWTPKPEVGQAIPFWVAAEPFLGPAFDSKLPSLMGVGISAARAKFTEIG